MKLAARVLAHLDARGVPAAIVGGVALGAHGIARATLDVDVLVTSPAVLEARFWTGVPEVPVPEIRRGDADDPMGGVVRLVSGTDAVDVLVGHGRWMDEILGRRLRLDVGGLVLPVVDAADLVLLKLYAAGPQDLLDVRLLLAADPALRATVAARTAGTPRVVRDEWEALPAAGGV